MEMVFGMITSVMNAINVIESYEALKIQDLNRFQTVASQCSSHLKNEAHQACWTKSIVSSNVPIWDNQIMHVENKYEHMDCTNEMKLRMIIAVKNAIYEIALWILKAPCVLFQASWHNCINWVKCMQLHNEMVSGTFLPLTISAQLQTRKKAKKNIKQKQTNNNNKGDNELFENSKLEENMPILHV